MRKTIWTTIVPAALLALAGAYLGWNLQVEHLGGKPTGLAAQLCDLDQEGGCAKVLASRWAVFPPRPATTDESVAEEATEAFAAGATTQKADETAGISLPEHIPTATLGLSYFAFMAAWLILIGRPSWNRRGWHLVPMVVGLAGVAMSIFFIYIMTTELKEVCRLCLASHITNFIMFVFIVLSWPVRPAPAAQVTEGEAVEGAVAPPPPPPMRPHPGFGQVVAIVLAGIALFVGVVGFSEAADLRTQNEKLEKQYAEIAGDANRFLYAFWQQEKQEIPVRDDDPMIRAVPGQRLTLVLFSDLQCPYCAQFEQNLAKDFLGMFNQHMRVVFKHFPLCSECNPEAGSNNMHPQACQAAFIAEAARMQCGPYGSFAFWKMRNILKPRKKPWSDAEIAGIAGALQQEFDEANIKFRIDPRKLLEDSKSEAVKKRVAEDIELARSLGIRGTPTCFLNGRQVPRYSLNLKGFWEPLADLINKAWANDQAKKQREKAGGAAEEEHNG